MRIYASRILLLRFATVTVAVLSPAAAEDDDMMMELMKFCAELKQFPTNEHLGSATCFFL
jgi:hypothetical protein